MDFLRKVKQLYGTAEISNDTLLFKDGRLFERYTMPMMEDGTVIGRLWSFRDVTDRKQAEEEKEKLRAQLQQAMKMEAVGRLAGGVAHDFNNLLTAIMGNVSLALMKLPPSDPVGGLLAEANKAAESAASLTQQLLAFSRKQIIKPKDLDLNTLIADMNKMLCPPDRGEHRSEDGPRRGPRTGKGRRRPVRADPGQPGGERPRRDAGRREAAHRDRERGPG